MQRNDDKHVKFSSCDAARGNWKGDLANVDNVRPSRRRPLESTFRQCPANRFVRHQHLHITSDITPGKYLKIEDIDIKIGIDGGEPGIRGSHTDVPYPSAAKRYATSLAIDVKKAPAKPLSTAHLCGLQVKGPGEGETYKAQRPLFDDKFNEDQDDLEARFGCDLDRERDANAQLALFPRYSSPTARTLYGLTNGESPSPDPLWRHGAVMYDLNERHLGETIVEEWAGHTPQDGRPALTRFGRPSVPVMMTLLLLPAPAEPEQLLLATPAPIYGRRTPCEDCRLLETKLIGIAAAFVAGLLLQTGWQRWGAGR